jgi:hypothetical protein
MNQAETELHSETVKDWVNSIHSKVITDHLNGVKQNHSDLSQAVFTLMIEEHPNEVGTGNIFMENALHAKLVRAFLEHYIDYTLPEMAKFESLAEQKVCQPTTIKCEQDPKERLYLISKDLLKLSNLAETSGIPFENQIDRIGLILQNA